MDAAVVTSSLQSLLVPTSASDSRASATNHNSNTADDEDVVQATSALLQDLDQVSELNFTSFTQSSMSHTNRQLGSQQGLSQSYDARKDLSPFSQSFLGQNADSGSPGLMTTDSITMSAKECMVSTLSQHIKTSAGNQSFTSHSDPLSHFINCGNVSNTAELEAVFSGTLQDASGSQFFQQPDHSLDQTSLLLGQTRSPTAYQPLPAAHQMPGITISLPEDGQDVNIMPVNPATGIASQPNAKPDQQQQQQNKKPNVPPPPKKPLSPYMRFSKGVWQQVKASNPGMSVCEVGAAIGRIWRELSDTDKQHYIDEFNTDKARYDGEFQNYLKQTGLQASDLVKPRGKKKETKEKQSNARAAKQQQEVHNVSTAVIPDHLTQNQDQLVKPQGQVNEMTAGNNPQETFLVNRPDGVHLEGMSSLPSFSQVWSNPEFMNNQDLITQMVLTGQTMYQQQQQQQQVEDAQRIPLDGSNQQVQTPYSDSGMAVNRQQIANVQRPPSSINCATNDPTTGTVSGQSNIGTKGWPWQQIAVSSQGIAQSNEGILVYQLSANGASLPSWSLQQNNQTTNQQDGNGQLTLRTEAMESNELPMMSTIQGQYGNAIDGIGCVYQMTPNMVCVTDDSKRGIIVDSEKLQLRNALVEKSEEVLRLMKELEQAYSLIHQLKQQNDFFHQQWNLHHHSAKQSSGDAEQGGSST